MNILFDIEATQPNSAGKFHGGGKYGEIILNRIIERGLPISVFYNSSKWLNPKLFETLKSNNIKMFDCSSQLLDDIIKANRFDLLYTPLLSKRTLNVKNCKVIATIHGLREFELPVDPFRIKYSQERNLRTIITNFLYYHIPSIKETRIKQHIRDYKLFKHDVDLITVSYHSAYSIKSFFPKLEFDTNKVFYSPSTVLENYEEKNKDTINNYFLLVSGNRWEKNNLRALMALDELFSDGALEGYKVVITGASSHKAYKHSFTNLSKFEFVGYVDDKELSRLYHNAYCLVYPSLNEGFGYPTLEAMYHGTPVIASSWASIQEVCNEAALYVNPMSISEIKNRINMILTPSIWEKYSSLGKIRYKEIRKKQNKDLELLIDYIYRPVSVH